MKISVVVPVYNVVSYISRCFHSLLDQDFEDYEIIFVDDCSTDGSYVRLQNMVEGIAKADVPVTLIKQDKNMGPGAARNVGMSIAKGDWCVFVDSDDWVGKDYLKNLWVDDLRSGDLIIGGVKYERGQDGRRSCKRFDTRAVLMNDISNEVIADVINYSYPVSKLFDLCLIREERLRFKDISLNEDTEFVLAYLLAASRIVFVDACDYHYVYYNSISLTKRKRAPEEYAQISELLSFQLTRLFSKHSVLSIMGLRKQYQKYVLGPLLQAVESSYLFCPRDSEYRQALIRKIKGMRGVFLKYYRPSRLVNAWALVAILFIPVCVLDPLVAVISKGKRN